MIEDLPCRELVELVTAYLDDALMPDTRRRFDAHLDICDGCREYLEQVRTTVAVAGTLRDDDLDPGMLERLSAAFRDWRGQGSSR